MQALVSLLNKNSTYTIQKIWKILAKNFDITSEHTNPLAHFSYQVAEKYNIDKIKDLFTKNPIPPFTIYTTGIGIFNSSKKVIYIPVIKNENLYRLNNLFYTYTKQIATNPLHLYHPLHWIPHITLVSGNFSEKTLTKLLLFFMRYEFNWEIEINNISVLDSTDKTGIIFTEKLDRN